MFLLIRKHFLTGLFTLLPFAVAAWILVYALTLIWQLSSLMPQGWVPDNLFLQAVVVAGTIVALVFGISLLGWVSKQFLGKKILEFVAEIVLRIPVVRSIYSALDQLLKTMAPDSGGQQFSRVVYLEYPRKGIWTLGFVTGPARGRGIPDSHLNVYVPTTPNPTSGFHLIVPESEVKESHLKVEEAFKVLLSLGIAQPRNEKK